MNASSILIVLVALATPSMVWATEPPLKTFDGTWKGSLVCGDEGAEVAFSAARRAQIKNGRITLRRGQPNRNRFEAWEGVVEATGSVMIFGRYFWKTQKPLWFKGQVTGRKLKAVGQRGPKVCELSLVRVIGKTKPKAKRKVP